MLLPANVVSFIKSRATLDVESASRSCVLSVYVDQSESQPAKRQAFREWLRGKVRAERQRVTLTSPERVVAFERCLTALEARLPDLHAEVRADFSHVAGWMILCSADDEVIEERVATGPPWICHASPQPLIMPYLASSLPGHTVIVLIDRERATIARVQRGVMQLVDTIEADLTGDAHDALLAAARRKLSVIASHDSSVVIGGEVPSVAQFMAQLPEELAHRAVVAEGLHVHTPFPLIPPMAHAALTSLITLRQQALLDALGTKAHLTRRASFALGTVRAAARAGAIDRLLISMNLWAEHTAEVECIAQQAIRAGACVEAATANVAVLLDQRGGIGADLRFAVQTAEYPAVV